MILMSSASNFIFKKMVAVSINYLSFSLFDVMVINIGNAIVSSSNTGQCCMHSLCPDTLEKAYDSILSLSI